MNRKLFILCLEITLGFLACFIFLWAWVCYVEPFPDRDSLYQTLYPVLNYLKASSLVGNDFLFLKQLMPAEYPSGILIIPWIIAMMGLQQSFIDSPWLINIFLLLPLCITAWMIKAKDLKPWAVLFLIFFFPPVQLCLKNLNLHSFIVIYSLAGIFLIYDYRKRNRILSAVLGILLLTFTCAVKHLGLIIFINLWITFLLWKKRKRESLSIPFCLGIAIIVTGIQFYPEQSLIPYFESLKSYNPLISSTLIWIMGGSAVFILITSWFQGISEDFGRSPIEHLFINIKFFTISSFVILVIFTLQPDFHGLVWMLLSFVVGNALLISTIRWGQLQSDNGFIILAFIMLTVTALVFYFSRLGQVSAFFTLPFLLLLILIARSQISNSKLYLLGALFFLISNFFPSLTSLESLAGEYGFRFYARGLNMIHQNPLGWQTVNVNLRRKSLETILKTIKFNSLDSPVFMGRYGLHHHDAVQLHYPNQYFYDIPNISLPEDLPKKQLKDLYSDFLEFEDNFYTHLLEKARIPIILVGNSPWVRYENESSLKIDDKNLSEVSSVKSWLHDPYYEFLQKQDLLSTFYQKYSIESEPQKLDLYIHRKLVNRTKESSYSKSLEVLYESYKKYNNPDIIIAQNYLSKSNGYVEKDQILPACVLLMKAKQLDPHNQAILQKLLHIQKILSTWELEILNQYGWEKLANILEEYDTLPWSKKEDWNNSKTSSDQELISNKRKEEAQNLFKNSAEIFDTDPEKAILLLEKVLELDPLHQEASKDLEILQAIKLAKPEETELSERQAELNEKKAELLFKESTKYFEIDPSKAIAVLRKVLELDPNHIAAKEDMVLVKERKAELLFRESTKYFEIDPSKSIEVLTKVLELDPNHKAAKEDIALAKTRIKNGWNGPITAAKIKADELFNEASKVFDSNPDLAESMLRQAVELNPKHKEALEDLKVIEEESSRIKASNLYHESLKYQQNHPQKALLLLEKTIKLDPNHKIARQDIKQIKTFLKSNSIRKAQAKWFFSRAKSMLSTNQLEAELNLRKALEMDPGSIEYHELADQLFRQDE